MVSDFKLEIEAASCDIDRDIKLHHCLAGMYKTTSVAIYKKDFHYISLELGD